MKATIFHDALGRRRADFGPGYEVLADFLVRDIGSGTTFLLEILELVRNVESGLREEGEVASNAYFVTIAPEKVTLANDYVKTLHLVVTLQEFKEAVLTWKEALEAD